MLIVPLPYVTLVLHGRLDGHLRRCGLDNPVSKAHITEYLASGALVLTEHFIAEIAELDKLPTLSLNDLCIALENGALGGSLAKPLFSIGEVVAAGCVCVGVSEWVGHNMSWFGMALVQDKGCGDNLIAGLVMMTNLNDLCIALSRGALTGSFWKPLLSTGEVGPGVMGWLVTPSGVTMMRMQGKGYAGAA
jgi:hypothetical protein